MSGWSSDACERSGEEGLLSLLARAAFALGAVMALQTLVWLVSLRRDDVSIVDPVWGPSFALMVAVVLLLEPEPGARALWVSVAVFVWAVRLAVHLVRRHDGEDPRYAAMRDEVGPSFRWRALVTVFWLQAVLAWIVAWPLFTAVASDAGTNALDAVAMAIFVVGLTFEVVADRQLTRFRRDPANRGRVLDSGLWRYSRHPNYFGEAVLWWGLWLAAVAAGAWWTVFSPVIMTLLLLRVSGVPLLERRMRETRPAYRDYVERTPAFVPWFPKEDVR